MKDKVKQALKGILGDVRKHEAETEDSDVTVDLADLKRLLRWVQNDAHIWFNGDKVEWTGASIPFNWVTEESVGIVVEEGLDSGTPFVKWDTAPEHQEPIKMFHNEIKLVK